MSERNRSNAEFYVYGADHFTGDPTRQRDEPANQWSNVDQWSWKPHDPVGIETLRSTTASLRESWQAAACTNYRPSKSRQQVTLIFDMGLINAGLKRWFDELDLSYFFLSYEQLVARGSVTLEIDDTHQGRLRIGDARVDLRDVSAVIWEPPWSIVYQTPPSREFLHEELWTRRWGQFLRDMRGFVAPDALWLPSHPLAGSQHWQDKVREYVLARESGLNVPPTICTNDVADARAFIRRNGKVMFREFSMPPFSTAPILIDSAQGPISLRNLRRSPCIFQKYIEKQCDVRAVAIGDNVFACRIDSQASPLAQHDWRVHDNARVRWDQVELPADVCGGMLALMRRLELNWGSFDLVQGHDGRYHFLEVNRPGASYWLLPFVGLDVAREIANMLKIRFAGG